MVYRETAVAVQLVCQELILTWDHAMAPPDVGGAHGHHVISIVSVIKKEHVLLCKDTFNPQSLGIHASCVFTDVSGDPLHTLQHDTNCTATKTSTCDLHHPHTSAVPVA